VPVLMFEGALFGGGWQHRVLAGSVLVGARTEVEVDVRCVEQRRWGGGHDQRLLAQRAPLAVRGALRGLRREDDRFAAEETRHSDQSDVWERVQHYEHSHGASRTSSLVEVQGGLDRQVAAILDQVRPLPAQRGVLIGVDGHPALLEVFDHPDTLAAQWDAILASVAMDALLLPVTVPTPGHRARAFIQAAMATRLQDVGPAGAALAVAGSDRVLVSARGVATDRVIHAAVVNARHRLVLAA
jgi:ARG and Rhodanese-Phosphatase-superfamily-associated Protein domain